MANDLDNLWRELTSGELDFKSPISEDIAQQFGRVIFDQILALIVDKSDKHLVGAIDSTPTTAAPSVLTDTNPTSGSFDRDDQYNGLYVHFTSGTIYTNNNYNRYKITDTDATAKTLTVNGDLNADGATVGDTYRVLPHTHDNASTNPDGTFISLIDLVNQAEGDPVTQDVADALTDPNGNRPNAADISNPFITLLDSSVMNWVDDGTKVINDSSSTSGTVSIVSQVPAGTNFCQLYIEGGSDAGFQRLAFREPSTGTYRDMFYHQNASTGESQGSCAWVKVSAARLIDRSSTISGTTSVFAEVRSYT